MKSIKKLKNNLQVKKAIKYLNEGKVVAIPTETVYGMFIKAAPKKDTILNRIKQRDIDKAVGVFFPSRQATYDYVDLSDYQKSIMQAEFPGNKTIIVPTSDKGKKLLGSHYETVGLRVPSPYDSKYLLKILEATGPLFATSINIHGQPEINNAKEIKIKFAGTIDFVVKAKLKNPRPSTVLDLTKDYIKVLRK